MSYGGDLQLAVYEVRGLEVVAQRHVEAHAQTEERGGQSGEELVAAYILGLVALARGEQYREDVEYGDTARRGTSS